jgi:hypothetical protein
MFFSNKMNGERLHSFIRSFIELVASENGIKVTEANIYKISIRELQVTCEKVYELCLEYYRELKIGIYNYMAY